MSLADYLANKYLSADNIKPSKKRKRKEATAQTETSVAGLTIAEDDVNTFPGERNPDDENDDDEDAPTVVADGRLAGGLNKFGKKKKSNWIKIGSGAPSNAEQAAADEILAAAQAENLARAQEEDDEQPAIVKDDGRNTMASGAMAGLQSAEQVAAAIKKKEKEERKAMKAAGLDTSGLAQQTIYRDASGRMINVKAMKDEAAAREKEEARREQEELESRKGEVQRREKEERKRELENAKVMTVARHADDQQLNDDLKQRERWNDPMAQLLTTKKSKSGKSKGGGGVGKTYQGAFEPNRYGIRPGWRWDGVDRGNGFERKWFAARNKAKDREELEYAWQMDE